LNKKTRFVDGQVPAPALVQEAVRILQRGGMLVLPTRHLYGLGVDALNPDAVARVFAVKRRSAQRPLLVLLGSREEVSRYAVDLDARVDALMDAFWPGKLTIVLKAGPALPAVLTGGSGRIGIRLAGHPVCRALVRALGRPITATSANLSGQPGCRRAADLDPAVAAGVDLILDAGPLLPGIGSTVIDIRPEGVTMLRRGAVPHEAIVRTLGCDVSEPSSSKGAASEQ
jgi:L-threonylcarbamoyladenylate synthase